MTREPRHSRGGPLQGPLSQHLREGVDELGLERMWRERKRRDRANATPKRRLVWGIAFVVTAATIALIAVQLGGRGPLRSEGEPFTGAKVPRTVETVAFDDGSRITLAAGSRFEVRANDGEHFDTVLDEGQVRLAVTPGGPRRWTIDAGTATIVVVGTELTVTRRASHDGDDEVEVVVFKGRVLVRAPSLPGGERSLGAGESVVVRTQLATAEPTPKRAPTSSLAPTSESTPTPEPTTAHIPTPTLEPTTVPEPTPTPPPTTPAPAHVHHRTPSPPAPTPAPPTPAPTPDALLALADKARAHHDPRAAADHLERFLATHPDHLRAPLAAFTLARLEADVLGQSARAAARLEAILDRLPAPLVPDALARLALARQQSGDHAGARTAAQRYLAAYPNGPRAHTLRPLIETPTQ